MERLQGVVAAVLAQESNLRLCSELGLRKASFPVQSIPHGLYAGVLGRRPKTNLAVYRGTREAEPRLYTYRLVIDDGTAPNPYGGTMTLAICKPAIRRTCQTGDVIVGLDARGAVCFVMKVTEKLTLADYWKRVHAEPKLLVKVPRQHKDLSEARYGDAIYDFTSSDTEIVQLRGAHSEESMDRDLRGGYAALSSHFIYAGDNPILLPGSLQKLVQGNMMPGQGHHSKVNQPYLEVFWKWLANSTFATVNGTAIQWGHIGTPLHVLK